jgi:hypothetical protein
MPIERKERHDVDVQVTYAVFLQALNIFPLMPYFYSDYLTKD